MNNLLDEGRTLYTDNYYTSISLAHQLLTRKTHLVGTVRSNRKFNCKEVTEKKLSRGESVARESSTGVIMLKWKDKRDVLMLSTKHTGEMKEVTYRGGSREKPVAILDYNNCKAFIDISDQLKAYNSCLRRGVKWYRKLAFELILGTAIVNAHILYCQVTNRKISITQFREEIIMKVFHLNSLDVPANPENRLQHKLENIGKRRRCVVCYDRIVEESGYKPAQNKTPRSNWQCSECNKSFCVECFFVKHKSTLE